MCADLRVATRQVAEMHLDERLEKSREVIGKQLAVGQQKVSSAYNKLWAEMEAMREAQRKRQEEARALAEKEGRPIPDAQGKCMSILILLECNATSNTNDNPGKAQAPDLTHAQANIQAAGTRAGAYFSSWGTWASEKRKGWGNQKTPLSSPGPISGDFKRADDFKREKDRIAGPGADHAPVDLDAKRESVIFDAEKDPSRPNTGVESKS